MRLTPDKDIILKLQAEGLSQRQIARRYGVSPGSIRWALHHVPKTKPPGKIHVPDHVIHYWRVEWGWSEEKIKYICSLYNQSLMSR